MPLEKNLKCGICGKRIRGTKDAEFPERMNLLRRHRKNKHPTAHEKSIEKTVETTKGGEKMGKKKKTYKLKSTAKKAKRKGETLYKVKGGWRISRK